MQGTAILVVEETHDSVKAVEVWGPTSFASFRKDHHLNAQYQLGEIDEIFGFALIMAEAAHPEGDEEETGMHLCGVFVPDDLEVTHRLLELLFGSSDIEVLRP